MGSDDGFGSFGQAIKSDPVGVLLARWRRDAFTGKLGRLPDVTDVIPSGSLAPGTRIGPVHDVDLIVVFDSSMHPDYGQGPASAQAAMEHLQDALAEQLGGQGPRETELRRHVVTYHGDAAGPFQEIVSSAPPVDVMPAVRKGSHLLIPERGTGWIDVDPEHLVRQVAERSRQWEYVTEVTGMVEAWAELNRLDMTSLAIEVMVLRYCPRPRLFETLSCGEAVARFFEAAAEDGGTGLEDPAGDLRKALTGAAGLARQAMDAEHVVKNTFLVVGEVHDPDEFWRQLFGNHYPRSRKRFFRPPAAEPWFGKYTEPGTNLWAGVFGSSAAAVPLTFG